MKVTPDIQFVRPAQKQVLDLSGSIPIIVKDHISTALHDVSNEKITYTILDDGIK